MNTPESVLTTVIPNWKRTAASGLGLHVGPQSPSSIPWTADRARADIPRQTSIDPLREKTEQCTLGQLSEQLRNMWLKQPQLEKSNDTPLIERPPGDELLLTELSNEQVALLALDPSLEQFDLRATILAAATADLPLDPTVLTFPSIHIHTIVDKTFTTEGTVPAPWLLNLLEDGTAVETTADSTTFWQQDSTEPAVIHRLKLPPIITPGGGSDEFLSFSQSSESSPLIPKLRTTATYALRLVRRPDGELDLCLGDTSFHFAGGNAEKAEVIKALLEKEQHTTEVNESGKPYCKTEYTRLGSRAALDQIGGTVDIKLVATMDQTKQNLIEQLTQDNREDNSDSSDGQRADDDDKREGRLQETQQQPELKQPDGAIAVLLTVERLEEDQLTLTEHDASTDSTDDEPIGSDSSETKVQEDPSSNSDSEVVRDDSSSNDDFSCIVELTSALTPTESIPVALSGLDQTTTSDDSEGTNLQFQEPPEPSITIPAAESFELHPVEARPVPITDRALQTELSGVSKTQHLQTEFAGKGESIIALPSPSPMLYELDLVLPQTQSLVSNSDLLTQTEEFKPVTPQRKQPDQPPKPDYSLPRTPTESVITDALSSTQNNQTVSEVSANTIVNIVENQARLSTHSQSRVATNETVADQSAKQRLKTRQKTHTRQQTVHTNVRAETLVTTVSNMAEHTQAVQSQHSEAIKAANIKVTSLTTQTDREVITHSTHKNHEAAQKQTNVTTGQANISRTNKASRTNLEQQSTTHALRRIEQKETPVVAIRPTNKRSVQAGRITNWTEVTAPTKRSFVTEHQQRRKAQTQSAHALQAELPYATRDTAQDVIERVLEGKQQRASLEGTVVGLEPEYQSVGRVSPSVIRFLEGIVDKLAFEPVTATVLDTEVVFRLRSADLESALRFTMIANQAHRHRSEREFILPLVA